MKLQAMAYRANLNVLAITFDYAAIREQFAIFAIRKDTRGYIRNDHFFREGALCSRKVQAIVYDKYAGGNGYLMLFPLTLAPKLSELRENLTEELYVYGGRRVDPETIREELLANLFMRAANNRPFFRDKDLKRNQIINGLFIKPEGYDDRCLDIVVYKGNVIHMNVKPLYPYHHLEKKNKPLFTVDNRQTGHLINANGSDKERYVMEKGKSESHNGIDWMSLNARSFDQSKCGILAEQLRLMRRVFSDCLPQVELEQVNVEQTVDRDTNTQVKGNKAIDQKIAALMNRVDVINLAKDETVIRDFLALTEIYKNRLAGEKIENTLACCEAGRPLEGRPAIIIVDSKEAYENKKDPYGQYKEETVQHITTDLIKRLTDKLAEATGKVALDSARAEAIAVIRVLLKEWLIKKDIADGCCTLFDHMEELDGWTFSMASKDEALPFEGWFNLTFNKGKMLFSQVEDDDEKTNYKIIHNGKEIAIMDTDLRVLPDVEKLYALYYDDFHYGDREAIAKIIKEHWPESEDYEEVQQQFGNWGSREIEKAINSKIKGKAAVGLNEAYKELTGGHVLLTRLGRNKAFQEEYYPGVTDLVFFTYKDSQYYAMSPYGSGMNGAPVRSSVCRKVEGASKEEFLMILKMLMTPVVRSGQMTVMPFPFKYLREYYRKWLI